MKTVKDEINETEVNDAKEVTPNEAPKNLEISIDSVNSYLAILNLIMVGDDRLAPLRTHFIETLKRENEEITEQPN